MYSWRNYVSCSQNNEGRDDVKDGFSDDIATVTQDLSNDNRFVP
jgi:hypothetical protein